MSTDFNQTAQTIIKDALILCGGLEDDENVDDDQLAHAMRTLNRMVKAWSKKGLKAWKWTEETLPLVTGQNSYTIGPTGDLVTERPLTLVNPRKIISGDETPIRIFSRQEYMDQPSKNTTGEPVAVYYDPQLGNGVLYVWQSPETGMTIKFSSKQYIQDFDTQSDNPEFPTEWLEAIVYNLAVRLAPMYEVSPEAQMMLIAQAEQFLIEAEGGDNEQGSVFFGVTTYGDNW